MRKILMVAGLLLGAALFTGTSSTPAQAWVGCICAKLNAPAVCVEGPVTCTMQNGGACVLPCDYTPGKAGMKHHGKKHGMKHKRAKKKG